MKSTCQISKGSLGSLNAHGRYGFLSQDCILDQWEEQGRHFFAAFLIFPHQYWFMNTISLLLDQWFNVCTIVRHGNFRILGRARLLLDPRQNSLFLSVIRFPTLFLLLWALLLGISDQFFQTVNW